MRVLPTHEGSDFSLVLRGLILLTSIYNLIGSLLVVLSSTPLTAGRSLAPVSTHAWGLYLLTVNETAAWGDDGGDGALTQFGFGVWGWCERDAGDYGGKQVSCVVRPFYDVDNAQSTDPVTQLRLPYAITHALSPTAFLIVFICAEHLADVTAMLCALCSASPFCRRRFTHRFPGVAALPLWPALITAAVGVHSLAPGLEGAIGGGLVVLIVGMVLDVLVAWPCSLHLQKREAAAQPTGEAVPA
ncbi:hypothetical protein Q5752_006587 [Cryptotrichosporon argae]